MDVHHMADLLGGVTTIQANILLRKSSQNAMYSTVQKPKWEQHKAQLVPYYAWSNRGMAEMTVFMPVIWEK